MLAIQFHPDKNHEDPNAKEKFQQINEAYQILMDPKTKQVYDMTGDLASSNIKDIRSFVDAYLYYREKYKQIDEQDIIDFEKHYKGGPEEEEDLIDYYFELEGDMTHLLEHIPLSTEKDIPRFIKYYEDQIDAGEIEEFIKKFKATKGKIRLIETEMSEAQSKKKMSDLAAAIQGKQKSRGDAFASLFAKYGSGDPLSLEEGKRSREKEKKQIQQWLPNCVIHF